MRVNIYSGNRKMLSSLPMKPSSFFLILALLYSALVHAQTYPISQYNTTHGLINNRVGVVMQDEAGYMWFGTDDGICNYDGRVFRFFPGTNSPFYFAHSYATHYNDSILFTTYRQGLAVCYKNSVRFITYPGFDTTRMSSALSLGEKGFLIATLHQKGVMILKDGKLTPVPLPDFFIQQQVGGYFILRRDNVGNIWLGTEKGVVVFPGGDLNKPVIVDMFRNKWINAIKADREGNIYIVTYTNVYCYKLNDLQSPVNTTPYLFFGGKGDMYSTIAFDQGGNVYVASQFYDGLRVLDKSQRPIMVINASNGLTSSVVWDVEFDKENNAWLGTENGLSKLNSIFFRSYTAIGNDFPNFRGSIFLNDSTLLGNNGNAMFLLINNEKIPLPTTGLDNNLGGFVKQRFFKTSDGELWLNVQPTVNIDQQETHRIIIDKKIMRISAPITGQPGAPKSINLEAAVTAGKGKDYLLDFNRQLWIHEKGKFSRCPPANTFPALESFDAISVGPDGELWLTNNKYGLLQAKINSNKNGYNIDTVCFFPVVNPTPRSFPNRILVDHSGAVWLTSSYKLGAFIYRKNTAGQYQLSERINTEQLDHNYIREIANGPDGIVYIGTNFGIYRITVKNSRVSKIDKDVFGQYLTGKYIYFLHYKNDKLYIGTTGSAAIVEQPERSDSAVAPVVYITGMNINGKQADSLLQQQGLKLATNDNTISFTFTSPTFIDEQKTAFKYYLEGVDDDWSAPTFNYAAIYSELRPGKYVLKVLAQNAKGVWSKEPAVFAFTIRAPFYKQWWFVALCILAIASVMYALYRFRLSKLLAVE
ncbi:MAG TPA: two-component regulator propeller domain-containing protein, partial [Chitinophagaceae bacterium]|nr:two-component regulator propeller domain-containing protein [Chitinophagaceae bacterium]